MNYFFSHDAVGIAEWLGLDSKAGVCNDFKCKRSEEFLGIKIGIARCKVIQICHKFSANLFCAWTILLIIHVGPIWQVMFGLHVRQIVLKNVIYLLVWNIYTYYLYKTTHHLITSTKGPKNGIHGIRFYVQSGDNHYLSKWIRIANYPRLIVASTCKQTSEKIIKKLVVNHSTQLLLLFYYWLRNSCHGKLKLKKKFCKGVFFKKMDQPQPLFSLFSVFSTNNDFYITKQCKKCLVHPVFSAGIQTHDLSIMSCLQ